MSVINIIKEFIKTLPETALFTTRMMLDFGSRTSVDNAMYLLVKDNYLERYAWGVFRLSDATRGYTEKEPPMMDIIMAKSGGFTRTVVTSTLEILDKDFARILITGQSSTFRRVYNNRFPFITVEMQAVAPRKVEVVCAESGKALLAIWKQGRKAFRKRSQKACLLVPRILTQHLPHWITDALLKRGDLRILRCSSLRNDHVEECCYRENSRDHHGAA